MCTTLKFSVALPVRVVTKYRIRNIDFLIYCHCVLNFSAHSVLVGLVASL